MIDEFSEIGVLLLMFISGVSHTKYKHTVEDRIEPIAYAIFVPIFFVSIGLSVKLEGVGSLVVNYCSDGPLDYY
jgi:Kef-type K+ transport system membrane component KefB